VTELWHTVISPPEAPWGKSAPAIGDVDNDGDLEIAAACRDRTVLLDAEGEVIWSTIEPSEGETFSAMALGDLDGNGTLEVVLGSKGGVIHAFETIDGKVGDLTTFDAKGELDIAAPILADLDGKGGLDILATTAAGTYAIKTPPFFPAPSSAIWHIPVGGGRSHMAVADLNNDGVLDVAVDGVIISGRTGEKIGSFKGSGYSVIADLNGDGKLEIGAVAGEEFVITPTEANCEPYAVVWGEKAHDLRNTNNFHATRSGELKGEK